MGNAGVQGPTRSPNSLSSWPSQVGPGEFVRLRVFLRQFLPALRGCPRELFDLFIVTADQRRRFAGSLILRDFAPSRQGFCPHVPTHSLDIPYNGSAKRVIAHWLAGQSMKTKDTVRFALVRARLAAYWDKSCYTALWPAIPPRLEWFSTGRLSKPCWLHQQRPRVLSIQKLNFKANWIIRGLLLVEMMRPKLPAVSTCPVVASIWPPEATRAFRLLMGLAKFG